jgi:hypothetical protein
VRELKTIYFALKLHVPRFENSIIHIYTDNMTAKKHVLKSGGTASPFLQTIAIEITELLWYFIGK